MTLNSVRGYVLRGGGVRPVIAALTALIALAALLAGALLSLAPAAADGHDPQPTLTLSLLDDSDNIVPAGSEVGIEARLRFSGTLGGDQVHELSNIALTLSGFYDWNDSTSRRLKPADFNTGPTENPTAGRTALELLSPTRANGQPVGSAGLVVAAALHSRTLLATSVLGEAYLFDTWNRRQAAVISAPGMVDSTSTFGRTDSSLSNQPVASGAAVWQESENTAWLFIASPDDDIDGAANVGSVYIYKVNWGASPVEVTMVKRLVPPRSEFSNIKDTWGILDEPRYGSSITISGDGTTLAVGAQRMNHIGAVYVYTRPDAAGQSWGDLEYADGTKVTTAPTPPWGDPSDASTRPFDHTDANNCDWWCRKATMMFQGRSEVPGPFKFAFPDLAISRDGRVLVVPHYEQCHTVPSRTVAQGIGCAGPYNADVRNQGLVYVFVAPEGGWAAADLASAGGKTLIAAGANANGFNPANHYAPGPARRVTTENARLRGSYSFTANQYFGQTVAVSNDGLAIAVTSRDEDGQIHMFQQNSVSGWTGTHQVGRQFGHNITSIVGLGRAGLAFNRDNSVLLIGYVTAAPNNSGDVHFWNRAANGQWTAMTAYTLPDRLEPPSDANQGYFGARPIWGLGFQRWAVSWPQAPTPGFFLSEGHACATQTIDGAPFVSCPVGSGTVDIAPGTEDGAFTVAGALTFSVEGEADSEMSVRAEPLVITIGEVVEVAELKLERATDDRGTTDTGDDALFPDQVARGETTTLRIQVLNENGKAAATNSINLVSVQTKVGELSTAIGGSCRGGNGTKSCIIDGSALTASNSDKILVTLRHAGTAGAASVTARAISKQGEQATAGPLAIALTGAPASLSISEPTTGVLGYDTPDAGADVDARDMLRLAVTAADKDGAAVTVPSISDFVRGTADGGSRLTAYRWWRTSAGETYINDEVSAEYLSGGINVSGQLGGRYDRNPRVRVTGPDGQPVPISWYMTTDAAQDNVAVVLDVDTDPAAPLANGEYTLQVRAGGLTGEQTFAVVGGAASVELSEPSPAPARGGEFTIVATVTDADGVSVPNGTPIHWDDRTIGDETTMLVQTSGQATTTDGRAEARYLIVAAGSAVITVTADGTRTGAGGVSGGVSNVARVAAAEPATAAQPNSIADQLSATTPGAPTSWLGESSVTASALLNALDGVDGILLWQYGRWLSYAVVDGREVPGSYDFVAQPGAVLWLAE